VLLSAFVALFGLASGVAQSQKEDATASSDNERKFENRVPEHVPVKIKLKNEQSFKKKENKNWARELEIELKNTGTKPIYYIGAGITMPDIIIMGNPLGKALKYGRRELALPGTPVEPEDVPILPGESVTLKFSEASASVYEENRDKEGRLDPKRVVFRMYMLNYGDGTYYLGTHGVPMKSEPKKRSSNGKPLKDSAAVASRRFRAAGASSEGADCSSSIPKSNR